MAGKEGFSEKQFNRMKRLSKIINDKTGSFTEQQKAEAQAIENARQNEVSRRAAENQAAGTGGYQSSWGGGGGAKGDTGGFMGGSGTSADMGSFAYGGLARLL